MYRLTSGVVGQLELHIGPTKPCAISSTWEGVTLL